MLITKYLSYEHFTSQQNYFFLINLYEKSSSTTGRAYSDNFGGGLTMLHTNHLSNRHCGLRQKDFKVFPMQVYVKLSDPFGRANSNPQEKFQISGHGIFRQESF